MSEPTVSTGKLLGWRLEAGLCRGLRKGRAGSELSGLPSRTWRSCPFPVPRAAGKPPSCAETGLQGSRRTFILPTACGRGGAAPFAEEEKEAQRGQATCSRAPSRRSLGPFLVSPHSSLGAQPVTEQPSVFLRGFAAIQKAPLTSNSGV